MKWSQSVDFTTERSVSCGRSAGWRSGATNAMMPTVHTSDTTVAWVSAPPTVSITWELDTNVNGKTTSYPYRGSLRTVTCTCGPLAPDALELQVERLRARQLTFE
jgi:hypothetical protein